jgi:MFS family permease
MKLPTSVRLPRLHSLHLHVVLSTFNHVSFTGTRLAVLLYAIHLQASPVVAGVLTALFSLLSSFTAVAFGRWVDRHGAAAPMMVASLVAVAGGVLAWTWPGLTSLFVVATLIGTFHTLYQVATQQLVGRYGTAADRPANFALLSLGTSAATFSGPVVAGLGIDHFDHATTFLMLAAFAFVPVPFLASRRLGFAPPGEAKTPPSTQEEGGGNNVWSLLRDPPLRRLYIVATLNNAVWSVVTFLIPLYGSQIGLSATRIGGLMACFATGTVLVRIAMQYLVHRFRPWQMVLVAQAVIASAFVGIPMTAQFALLLALVFWMGLGLGMTGPMSMALMYDASPADRAGEVVGLRISLANLCAAAVPVLSGAVGAAFGVAPVFWVTALALFSNAYSNRREMKT